MHGHTILNDAAEKFSLQQKSDDLAFMASF